MSHPPDIVEGMDLIRIFTRYPDHEACLEHLEKVRWADSPECPYCQSSHVGRKADNGRQGRWNCYDCGSSYNVLAGTIFSKTKIPLQKWFLALALMTNAKESLSSHQLARDLDLNQKSAWYLQTRIRAEMATHQSKILLAGHRRGRRSLYRWEAPQAEPAGRPQTSQKRTRHQQNPDPRCGGAGW